MRTTFAELLKLIPELNHDQRKALMDSIQQVGDLEKTCDLIEADQERQRSCPHCHSAHVHRHGKSAGIQRYKCQDCHRTYNALTGTPLSHLHKKELWLQHAELMRESAVLRKVAKELSIDLKTAFRWRHRFTEWLSNADSVVLEGIVEADETYFQKSRKGCKKLARPARKRGQAAKQRGLSRQQVCVVTGRDRSRHAVELISGTGPVKSAWLEQYLSGHIAEDAVMVTDGLSSYAAFSSGRELQHVVVRNSPGSRVKGAFHIQNVNAYHSRLKGWVNGHFHGVATKYLNHYLGWMRLLEAKNPHTGLDLFCSVLNQTPHRRGT